MTSSGRGLELIEPDAALATEHGVLSGQEIAARPECRRRVRSGAWTRYGRIIVTHNGPLTSEQADWVAVLACGPGSVLAALSAMRQQGVRVGPPVRPQVVIPAVRRVPAAPLADVRRSRLLAPTEVHPARQPPTLRLARATLDAASLARGPDDVRGLLCLPVQQRCLRVAELRDALTRLGPHVHRSLVLRTLDELELGVTSVHESRFTRLLRHGGLPEPERQVLCQLPTGRRYLDVQWQRYDVHVEIDGLAHMLVRQWLDDLDRNNELAVHRLERRLRVAGFRLTEDPDRVLDLLRRALLAGGWRP